MTGHDRWRPSLSGATSLVLLLAGAGRGEDWPQFRGPNASGVSVTSKNLPTRFSAKESVQWVASLGEGISSPVIAAGRVFITGMTGPEMLGVACVDAAGGQRLWQREFPTGTLPQIMPPNMHASSTPAADAERVYVYFSTLGLLALDARDGRQLWRLPLPLPAYLMAWGAAHSPIVHEDLVILNQDDDLAPFLIAVDRQTGKQRWRTARPDMLAGYALPVLCTVDGRTDLVIAGSGKFKGYDPRTGSERWTCNTLLRTIMSTPAVRDGTIYVSVQSYGDTDRILKHALLEWKDTNQDGKLSRSEIGPEFADKFRQGDADGDNQLSGSEIDGAFQSPDNRIGGGNTIQAVRGGGSGNVTKTHLLWNLDNRAPSNIVSPLVLGDRLFIVKQGGLSSCFDIRDGREIWLLKRIRNLGNYYASPVAGDGKIYVPGANGFVVVLAGGPSLEVLASNDMEGTCIATPAIADDRLFIRTSNKLYCIAERSQP